MTNAEHLIENAMMAFKRDFERKENDDNSTEIGPISGIE